MSHCSLCLTETSNLFTLADEEDMYCEPCVEQRYQDAMIEFLRRVGSIETSNSGKCHDCGELFLFLWDTSRSGQYLSCTRHAVARVVAAELWGASQAQYFSLLFQN